MKSRILKRMVSQLLALVLALSLAIPTLAMAEVSEDIIQQVDSSLETFVKMYNNYSSGKSSSIANSVRITGNCNIRRGPGLGYEVIESVSKGDILEYWNSTVTDDRGVDWYNVIYGNLSAWVSAKYAVLEGGSGKTSSSVDDVLPKVNGRTDLFYALGYAAEDMNWLLGMQFNGYGYESSYAYANTTGSLVTELEIHSRNQKYCVQGVTYGMSVADAERQLLSLGWKSAGVYEEDYDLHQRFYTNAEGNEIDLYTYDYDNYQTVGNVIVSLSVHDRED